MVKKKENESTYKYKEKYGTAAIAPVVLSRSAWYLQLSIAAAPLAKNLLNAS